MDAKDLRLQTLEPMDTLFNRGRHDVDATLNRIHYSVCVGRVTASTTMQSAQETTTESLFRAESNSKVAEVYLYVGDGCLETIGRARDDRRDYRIL